MKSWPRPTKSITTRTGHINEHGVVDVEDSPNPHIKIKAICKKFIYELEHEEELDYFFDYETTDKIINIMKLINFATDAVAANTKNKVFLKSKIKILDVIEDIVLNVNI